MDKGRQRRLGCAVILLLVLLGIVLGVMSCRRGRQTTETAEIGGEPVMTHATVTLTTNAHTTAVTTVTETAATAAPTAATTAAATAPSETAPAVTAAPATSPATAPPTQAPTAPPETAASTAASTDPPTEALTDPPAPASDEGWELTLVNSTHPLPESFDIELTQLKGDVSVDSRIYPDLQAMFDDMRAQGVYPFVREGFRTRAYQQEIMDQRRNEYIAQGYSEETADSMARDYVAEPGTSEHELGLAVDINAATGSESWQVYDWLAANAYKYGFILRYPEDKTDITGINYEPWHYRYVGKKAAAEIYESGLTLEEYLGE